MGVTAPLGRSRPDLRAAGSTAPVDGVQKQLARPAFYNPFTDPAACRSRGPGSARTLGNGARLTLVPAAGQERIDAFAASATPRRATAIVASTGGSPPAGSPQAAPAQPPPTSPAAGGPAPGGGSGGGGSSGGSSGGPGGGSSGDGEERKERTFDQDDLAGAIISIIAVLLLLLLMWPRDGQSPAGDDAVVMPQMDVAPEPAPDPFDDAPVDLRPTSPPPEPAPPPPAPVEDAALSCPLDRRAVVLFCTDKDEPALVARDAFDAQINDWRMCIRNKPLVVMGYADTRGPKEYNIDLAARRARAIAAILRAEGFEVAEAIGFGELPDMEDGMNCANHRRADVMLREAGALPVDRSCAPPVELARIACP